MGELSHLDELEAEAIYIIREVAAECEKPVMLYSIGKDSSVMLHLAMKAFYPEKPPFPFLHVNTTWKFHEMIEFLSLIHIFTALGAEIKLTPGREGMKGAIDEAQRLKEHYGNAFIPQQFENQANPDIHRATTAQEIWEDTDGKVDIFVSSVGTGGTCTGTGLGLRDHNPDVRIVAVEPKSSPVLSGGRPGPHKIQGIGAGFIPKVMRMDIVDEVIPVENEAAFDLSLIHI